MSWLALQLFMGSGIFIGPLGVLSWLAVHPPHPGLKKALAGTKGIAASATPRVRRQFDRMVDTRPGIRVQP
jgi:hypothetical protein